MGKAFVIRCVVSLVGANLLVFCGGKTEGEPLDKATNAAQASAAACSDSPNRPI